METILTTWEVERVALVLLLSAHYTTTDGVRYLGTQLVPTEEAQLVGIPTAGVQQRHSTETETTRQNHTGTSGKRDHLPPRDQQGQHQEVDLPTCCCDEEEFHLHTTQIAGAIASEAHWNLPWQMAARQSKRADYCRMPSKNYSTRISSSSNKIINFIMNSY